MLKLARLGFLLLVAVLIGMPAAAQEDANPLLKMLAFVPDAPEIQDAAPLFSYVDYRAVEAARGIDTPTARDFADDTDLSGMWMAAMNGVVSGLSLNYFMMYLEGMEEALGFSWFDIDQALTFGQPPAMGKVLAGDFDMERIGAAFAARDYTEDMADGITVWCPPDGCDTGLETNLRTRDPANPFGGELGRREPIAALPGYVLNSPSDTVLTAMIETHGDEAASLAGNPDVRAAANVLADQGLLLQAQFFKLADVGLVDPLAALEGVDFLKSFGQLPPYRLMFVADTAAGGEQVALIGLVYADAETAKAAAEELLARVQVAESLAVKRPLLALIEERGAQVGAAYADKDDETGRAVAILEIRAPLPDNTVQEEGVSRYAPSGLGFRLLVDAIYRRDLSILWTDIPS